MTLDCDRFNSSIFEMSMANVIVERKEYTEEDVKEILLKAKREQYQFLSVKVDTGEKRTANLFLKEGFDLVDTQIMYQIPLKMIQKQGENGFVRLLQDQDRTEIMLIAKTAFVLDQFHGNPMLPQEKSDLYYEQWAKNLCEGLADDMFVIEKKGDVAGFLSVTYHESEATVGLAAIDPKHQKEGLFTSLLAGSIYDLQKRGYKSLYYGTQLANLPVLRTMRRFSGVPVFSKYVLHKMF